MVCNYTNVTINCGWFTHCCPEEVGCCLSVWTVIWTALTLLAGVLFFILVVYWACRTSGYRTSGDRRGVGRGRPHIHHRSRCRARAREQDQDPDQAERVIRTCEFKDKRKKFPIQDLPRKSCMDCFPTKPPKKLEAEGENEEETPTSTKDETPRTRHEASCLAHSEGSSTQECQCGVGMIRVWSDAEGLGGGPFISVQGINPSH